MAQVVVEMSGDEAKLYRSYQRIIDQANKLDEKHRHLKKSGDESFGGGMQSMLSGYVGSLGGATVAAGALVKMLSSVKAEAEAAGQAMRQYGPAFGQLAQLASTKGEMRNLVAGAKATYAEGGAKTLESAAAIQFSLESVGAGGMRADFARLAASGVVPDAKLMAESASMLQKAFGQAETGDFRAIVSKAFGGGKLGIGTAEQLLGSTAKVGAQAARLKLSDEETLAAIATASATLGPDEAGTAVQALLKGIEVEGIGGGYLKKGSTLQSYIQQLKAKEAAGGNIRNMLGGRQEAVIGYGLLSNVEGTRLMGENMANIGIAQRDDWMGQKIGLARGIPENRAAMAAQQAEAAQTMGASRSGMLKLAADSLQADMAAKYEQRYSVFGEYGRTFGRVGGRLAAGVDRWMGDASFVERRAGEWAGDDTKEVIQMWRDAATDVREAAKNLSDNSGRQRAAVNAQPE